MAVKPEDLDPWPGGLRQMYSVAEPLVQSILKTVVGPGCNYKEQILSADDVCSLLLCEAEDPKDDLACLLFPGCDQLDGIKSMDNMCGDRTLVLMNPQFRRIQDFGFFQRGAAKSVYFDRGYETTFSTEEFACRGEDMKLQYEFDEGWTAFALFDGEGSEPTPLLPRPLPSRPEYPYLEQRINDIQPEPLWARKLAEANSEGPRFMR